MNFQEKINALKGNLSEKETNLRERMREEIANSEISSNELVSLISLIQVAEEQFILGDFKNIESFSSEISGQFSAIYKNKSRKQEILTFFKALNGFPDLITSMKSDANEVISRRPFEQPLLCRLLESIKTYKAVIVNLEDSYFSEMKISASLVFEALYDFTVRELITFEFKIPG
jgi:hypothetical protein